MLYKKWNKVKNMIKRDFGVGRCVNLLKYFILNWNGVQGSSPIPIYLLQQKRYCYWSPVLNSISVSCFEGSAPNAQDVQVWVECVFEQFMNIKFSFSTISVSQGSIPLRWINLKMHLFFFLLHTQLTFSTCGNRAFWKHSPNCLNLKKPPWDC